jgi:hypothetical protein
MATKSKPPVDRNVALWMERKWRPIMAFVYMVICVADFVIFPVVWALAQTWQGTTLTVQWLPITLQGAGLFHMAMGAILGVAAWGRTKEKLSYAESSYEPMSRSGSARYRASMDNDDDGDNDVVYGREK